MKPRKLTKAEMAAIFKEQEEGVKVTELCRRHGISVATFYRWRARYGRAERPGNDQLRRLQSENISLRRLLVTALAENLAFKEEGAAKPEA